MCESTPVRLILATSDPGIYSNNKYEWSGMMYVSVECGDSTSKFSQMDASPFTWSFCNSVDCRERENRLNIIFTFRPTDNDPSSQLKFVVDTRGYVVSRPNNKIHDSTGKEIDLDIEAATRHGSEYGPDSLLEIWLSRGMARGTFLPKFEKNAVNWGGIGKILAWILIIAIVLIIFYYI